MDKSSITKLILEKINEAGEITLEIIFPRHRAESRVWRQMLGFPTSYEFSPRTFSAILSRLKSQGLVVKKGNHGKSLWSLTKKGSDLLIDEISAGLPQEDGLMRLVIFDVPESERGKRDLMRTELVACGYNQLQKSVWVGYRPLPERFIKNLDDLKLKDKVEIFSVNKKGTLDKFIES
ncbi:MAG: hypothetical protein AAB725_02845 [Patescibacteria group bacterium]